MKYPIIVQPPAIHDIEAAFLYIRDRSLRAANRWLSGIQKAIESLDRLPARCGLARESQEFGEEIRQLLFGKRQYKYRILFVIRENAVRILHVRHGARDALSPGEINL